MHKSIIISTENGPFTGVIKIENTDISAMSMQELYEVCMTGKRAVLKIIQDAGHGDYIVTYLKTKYIMAISAQET
jgi:hypothetical protein